MVVVRLISQLLNATIFILWAKMLTLEEFGILSVCTAISSLIFGLIDLGHTQTGPKELTDQEKNNIEQKTNFIEFSIAFKVMAVLATVVGLSLIGVLQELVKFKIIDTIVLSFVMLSMIGTAVFPSWIGIGISNKSYYICSSLLPRAVSIVFLLLLYVIDRDINAVKVAIVNSVAITSVSLLGMYYFLHRQNRINIRRLVSLKVLSKQEDIRKGLKGSII